MVNRNNTERGRGRGRLRPPRSGRPAGRMPLSSRRGPLGLNARPSQHSIAKSSHKPGACHGKMICLKTALELQGYLE
ncbi:hypothetical protein V6N11_020597 [Hibiscus sabdariffa]|uniref:Uncharacterized protein n=1 Tax=Hibiscus sabdariffa TaxID=183260 RepID=A0ABR2Q9D8_9ROSI